MTCPSGLMATIYRFFAFGSERQRRSGSAERTEISSLLKELPHRATGMDASDRFAQQRRHAQRGDLRVTFIFRQGNRVRAKQALDLTAADPFGGSAGQDGMDA